MQMFNKLFSPKPKIEPKVGMRLGCKVWGKDYTAIKITRVSEDRKLVLYKFLNVKGTRNNTSFFGSDSYEATWNLLLDTYEPYTEENE